MNTHNDNSTPRIPAPTIRFTNKQSLKRRSPIAKRIAWVASSTAAAMVIISLWLMSANQTIFNPQIPQLITAQTTTDTLTTPAVTQQNSVSPAALTKKIRNQRSLSTSRPPTTEISIPKPVTQDQKTRPTKITIITPPPIETTIAEVTVERPKITIKQHQTNTPKTIYKTQIISTNLASVIESFRPQIENSNLAQIIKEIKNTPRDEENRLKQIFSKNN